MLAKRDTDRFEESRPQLLGLAYRILGSRTDAEDAVQDTFLKWASAERAAIKKPAAWLMTVCTRRCLDLLKTADRRRVAYVGAWLPEPIHATGADTAESKIDLSETLTTAFLLILERLPPKQRAAYLLHEIFDVSYSDVADTLAMQESACRKLVSRAKANIDQAEGRHKITAEKQYRFLNAFQAAITEGARSNL